VIRFIIAIWDPHKAASNESASKLRDKFAQSADVWTTAYCHRGLSVFLVSESASGNCAIPIVENFGMILGIIYPTSTGNLNGAARSLSSLSQQQAKLVMASGGRHLVSEYWGSYIFVMREPVSDNVLVMRSPMSQLPCFEARVGGVTLLFSSVDDVIQIANPPLTVNWDSLVGQAAIGDHLTNETCLNEIRTIETGECVVYCADRSEKYHYWTPAEFQRTCFTGTFGDAARELRRTTEFCVKSWASNHKRILLTLSGGLDSSIVLSCLRGGQERHDVSCVTFYSRDSGDERRFARCMADAADCELVELHRNDGLRFDRFLECVRTVRPIVNGSIDAQNSALLLAQDMGASALFNGELGDNVFGSNVSIGMLVDCFRDCGISRRSFNVLLDYAILSKQSVWRAARLAIREGVRARRRPHFSQYEQVQNHRKGDPTSAISLVNRERLEQYLRVRERFIHPWKLDARKVVTGSRDLLDALITVTSPCASLPFSSSGQPIRVSPLISQPLVELALRIPPYFHVSDAQNRSVARTAFSDVLPIAILGRGQGKGGPHLWVRDYLRKNEALVREFLLGGLVVAWRLLDPSKIAAALSADVTKFAPMAEQLLDAIYIESWLRKWDAVGAK
jgi:asparagine synthase (glutamine-hydrolysing)